MRPLGHADEPDDLVATATYIAWPGWLALSAESLTQQPTADIQAA
jgi:hypothetical protein